MHSSSPCISSVGMPATSTTICSGRSVAPAAAAKRSPSRKSRLPTMMPTGHAGCGDRRAAPRRRRRPTAPQLVVADPAVEEVAEDVEHRRPRGPRAKASNAASAGRAGDRWRSETNSVGFMRRAAAHGARGAAPVGQPEMPTRGACSRRRSSARVITTSSVGTFWWKPLLPVFTPLILSTTSCPATTLPNTQ